ncbi:NADH:flavin oxidoreductase [Peptoniphilaceae bacterium SGI.131]
MEEIKIGNLSLRSRIVLPPIASYKSKGGMVDQNIIEYYKNFAKNSGIGLIITEHAYIDISGKVNKDQVSFADDSVLEGQKKLVEAVHNVGGDIRIFAQINHGGAHASRELSHVDVISASEMDGRFDRARALSVEEIAILTKKFADAALRVKKAGYDGVEIHCAHSYLLNQFYSPIFNKRVDEYGPQSIENRIRFLLEVYREVRKSVGDFPVAVRLGGCDYMEGGSTIDDAVKAALILEKEGVDLVDLSGGACFYARADKKEAGYFSDMSQSVKAAIKIPVLLTGGVSNKEEALDLIGQNKADLIGIGRALIKNPELDLKY